MNLTQQAISPVDKKQEQIQELGGIIFDLLDTGFHRTNEKNLKFVRRAIANSIYDAPYLYSGKISKEAKEALVSKKIKRDKLCKEHPISRTLTAEQLISCYETATDKYQAKMRMISTLERGCKVNLVLSSENIRLAPFQKDYTLSEEEIYSKAGIELVDDEVSPLSIYQYRYIYGDIEARSIPEMAEKLECSKYRVRKMIDAKEIERVKIC